MLRIIRTTTLMILPLVLSCAAGNPSLWQPYIFDGAGFSPAAETTSGTVWLRNGHFPVISETAPGPERSDRLPKKTGAVAGICYLQTSGGKLSGQKSFTPYPDEQISLKNKKYGVFVTRTDRNGNFAEQLPTGEYELFCRGARTEIIIKQGETALAPIRGGKRMAD